jgi:hypothetical protein
MNIPQSFAQQRFAAVRNPLRRMTPRSSMPCIKINGPPPHILRQFAMS